MNGRLFVVVFASCLAALGAAAAWGDEVVIKGIPIENVTILGYQDHQLQYQIGADTILRPLGEIDQIIFEDNDPLNLAEQRFGEGNFVDAIKAYLRCTDSQQPEWKRWLTFDRIEQARTRGAIALPAQSQPSSQPSCPKCHGSGWVECKSCQYNGNSNGRIPCKKCGTTGLASCPGCGGLGRRADGGPCLVCGGSGTVRCHDCNGHGYCGTCSNCGGTGKIACTCAAGQLRLAQGPGPTIPPNPATPEELVDTFPAKTGDMTAISFEDAKKKWLSQIKSLSIAWRLRVEDVTGSEFANPCVKCISDNGVKVSVRMNKGALIHTFQKGQYVTTKGRIGSFTPPFTKSPRDGTLTVEGTTCELCLPPPSPGGKS